MSAKAKGTRNENRVRRHLEAKGWYVIRSSASGGPFDLIAVKRNRIQCIQVKTSRWPRSPEMEEMRLFSKRFDLHLIVPIHESGRSGVSVSITVWRFMPRKRTVEVWSLTEKQVHQGIDWKTNTRVVVLTKGN